VIDQASVERAADLFRAPEGSFDRLIRRRDRKRRNQRIGVFVVVAAIAAAGLVAAVSQLRSGPVPANENPAPVGNGEIVMVRGLFWNPVTNPELVAVDPQTGVVRHLVTCDQECSVSDEPWSPNGKKLLYSSGGSLYVLDFASGSSRELSSGQSGNGTFSPDGRQIAYQVLRKFSHGFFVTRRDGIGSRKLDALSGLQLWWYQWSPDGRSIEYFQHAVYFSDGSIGTLDLDGTPASRTLVSFPRSDHCGTALGCVHSVAMSPVDGRIAFVTYDPQAGSDTVRVIDPDDGSITVVASVTATLLPTNVPSRLAWSPDGSRIALAAGCQIWSIAPDGNDQALVKDLGPCTATPGRLIWSPDGAELAFVDPTFDVVGHLQNVTLYALTVDGGSIRRLATLQADFAVGGNAITWQPVPRTH
jgi:Tol biopolymer transport system component